MALTLLKYYAIFQNVNSNLAHRHCEGDSPKQSRKIYGLVAFGEPFEFRSARNDVKI